MKTLKSLNLAGLLTLGIAMLATPNVQSQPLDDRVTVNMPYTTTIGHKTLAPGDYVIQRISSPGGSRILLVYSDNGMKFETSAMTIPVLDPNVARDTKIILSRVGEDYYYDKVWVQGKSYGYQFLLPKEARSRQRELMAVTVPASSNTETTTTTTATTTTAAAIPEPPVVTQPETQAEAKTEVAVAEPSPSAEPEPAPLPDLPEQSADRAMDPSPVPAPVREEMPATSTAWLTMVLGGSSLLGMGMILRRKA